MNARVIIDPANKMLYSSYYIKGLYDVFGKKNVSFSSRYFTELNRKIETHSFDHYMAFVIIGANSVITKCIIDFRDKPSVKESAYRWCDAYAKVNFNVHLTKQSFHDKIVSIPPGFGINIWNLWETAYYCCSNLIRVKGVPIVSLKDHLADYYIQYTRPSLEAFTHAPEKKTGTAVTPYVFMIATLWSHKSCIEGTNMLRKLFIEACNDSHCVYEGGFYASVDHPQYNEYKKLLFKKPYSVDSYIAKTKLSAIVFNTPAVHNCHGWKLGEYLAMGKAIVSTPLSNQLPESLVHGEHIHIVSNSDDLKKEVKTVLNDGKYRAVLEEGARAYYSHHARPDKVIERMLKNTSTERCFDTP